MVHLQNRLPTVTVAIPCYNASSFIKLCLEALLQQSHPPDDILVIDDGSTDQSIEFITSYPVRLIKHAKNLGVAAGRNTALLNSTTDLIAYIDADAYANRDMLEQLVKYFSFNGFSGVGGQGIEANRETQYDLWRHLHASQRHGKKVRQPCDHLFGLCMAYRRESLLAVEGFDPFFLSSGEDMDIGYRLNKKGFKLLYTPEAIVYHQRQDTFESLKKMIYRWYYWGFIAKKKNHINPWQLAAGTLKRAFFRDPWHDLFIERNLSLVKLDLILTYIKLRSLADASKQVLPL